MTFSFNPIECVDHLAAAFGGLSQVPAEVVGKALARRMVNAGVRSIDPEYLNTVFQEAATALWAGFIDDDGTGVNESITQMELAFLGEFKVVLGGKDYLSTFILDSESLEGQCGALMEWAGGSSWQNIVHGNPPKWAVERRGEWDKVWASETPLHTLGLTVRTHGVLSAVGILTVEQLVQAWSSNLLPKVPGLGHASLGEIRKVVAELIVGRKFWPKNVVLESTLKTLGV